MRLRFLLLLPVLVFAVTVANAEKRSKKRVDKTEKKAEEKETAYEKLFKDKKCETVKGLITLHKMNGKIYFEFPLSLLEKDMLIGSTITETTDNQFGSVGEKPSEPLHIRFVKTDSTVTLRRVATGLITENPLIAERLKVSATPAIVKKFEIKAYNPDSTAVVFDMTDYLLSDNKKMDPFSPYSPIAAMGADVDRDFERENSQILKIKAFPDNVSVQSALTYSVSVGKDGNYALKDMPFTAVLTRTFILLPEEPMRPRMADPRIGIFFQQKTEFHTEGKGVRNVYYANRWRLEPFDEEAYRRGETVEPKKPIVFYIDDAFPEKWRKYVKLGVETWQEAFEKIGFKNAILAKDFPTDDPGFDPDNLKYSCIRYSPSQMANAMGPSWTDPRTGEIINASVTVYHNILELVQTWRFLQTAPTDPEARAMVLSDEVLGDCLRYVISHEVGHCLALMHNMSGSAGIPTDSLRSPSFTQKYGTTHSIMDYARNNYVAQPGDKEKGVKLTPPKLGLYDLYAVKWLYTPISEAKTSKEEVAVLDRWISEKSGDPVYRYGKQQFGYRYDPTAFEEDLGDDAVKASEYGIRNLKYLLSHLNEWVGKTDKDYAFRQLIYNEVVYQYVRYLSFVLYNIGGIHLNERYDGDRWPSYSTVPRVQQKKALSFLLSQLEDMSWIDNEEVLKGFPLKGNIASDLENAVIDGVITRGGAVSLCADKAGADAYTQKEYLKDLSDYIWRPTRNGKILKPVEKKMQIQYVSHLIKGSVSSVKSGSGKRNAVAADGEGIRLPEYVKERRQADFGMQPADCEWMFAEQILPCVTTAVRPEEIRGFDYDLKLKAPAEPTDHLYFAQLKQILALLKSKENTGSADTRQHYRLLIYKIGQALD